MADRKRSHDGTRETDKYIDDAPTPSQQGRAQGNLERKVGTRDELKNVTQGESSSRVRKSDEKGQGSLSGHHGTGGEKGEVDMARLSNGAWVLIADGEKALFLKNVTDNDDPHLQVHRIEEQENPKDIDQSANRPGRMQEGRPGGDASGPRSAFQDTDWHQLAKERFAHDLADILYKKAHKGAFDKLVIVAAPQVLGDLRKALHLEVKQRVIAEIPKTLTNHSLEDIEKVVASELTEA